MKKFDIKKFNPCPEGLEYYRSKTSFEQAWNECPRGDWMLWIASRLGVDDRTLTRAKALCANTIRTFMRDKRSTDAIDAALRYADGEISRKELNEYATAVSAADDDFYVRKAAKSAASVYLDYAAAAVSAAADYVERKSNELETANICREVLTKDVFNKILI